MLNVKSNIMAENPYQDPLDDAFHKLSNISRERRFAVSCYVPVFNIVTCAITAVRLVESRFCLFHARQGLVLFSLWVLSIVVAAISPILSLMLWGVVLALHFAGFVIAFKMKDTQIPVIGSIALKIPEKYLYTLLTGKK